MVNFIKTAVELTGFEIFKISTQIEENAENLCDHASGGRMLPEK